jgi:phosphomannomutase
MLLEKLGCEVVVINGEPNGNFAHMPEPLPENLVSLGEKVKEVSADIGFAQDPDADRLVMCNEEGVVEANEPEAVLEDGVLRLTFKKVVKKEPKKIKVSKKIKSIK